MAVDSEVLRRMQVNTDLLMTALADYGLTEVDGPGSNPEILAMAKEVGADYPSDDVSWCGLAVATWVKRTGGTLPEGFLAARSWLKWGQPAQTPAPGDIAVLWRTDPSAWEGHVGIFIKERGGLVYLLGGNQGNTVTVASFHKARLLGYRRKSST